MGYPDLMLPIIEDKVLAKRVMEKGLYCKNYLLTPVRWAIQQFNLLFIKSSVQILLHLNLPLQFKIKSYSSYQNSISYAISLLAF